MTDARKNDEGKLRYDLIPPEPLRELARVYTIGAKKYADNNWKNGLARHRVEAALMRHFEAFRSGETHDPEDGQMHLASVAWCAFTLMWYAMQEATPKSRVTTTEKAVERFKQELRELPEEVKRKMGEAIFSSYHDEVAKEMDRLAYKGGRMVD